MTKVEAIKKVMEDNNGTASWKIIYDNIGKYYPGIKEGKAWQAGIRGVLYREITNERNFKKIGLGVYALTDYQEQKRPKAKDKIRMHSFIEGICLELGNFQKVATYTSDPTAEFKDNIRLGDLATIKEFPEFTYPQILNEVKRIDVIWFNRKGLMFPQTTFEVVDSVGTLTNALNRSCQLLVFNTEFIILGPEEKHKEKFEQKVGLEPYINFKERYKFRSYPELIEYYEKAVEHESLREKFF